MSLHDYLKGDASNPKSPGGDESFAGLNAGLPIGAIKDQVVGIVDAGFAHAERALGLRHADRVVQVTAQAGVTEPEGVALRTALAFLGRRQTGALALDQGKSTGIFILAEAAKRAEKYTGLLRLVARIANSLVGSQCKKLHPVLKIVASGS